MAKVSRNKNSKSKSSKESKNSAFMIGTPKKKLKEESLGKFIGQKQNPDYEMGAPKRLVAINPSKGNSQEVQEALQNIENGNFAGLGQVYDIDKMAQRSVERKEYNKQVTVLDPTYSSLELDSNFILRAFIYTGDEYTGEYSSILTGTMSIPKIPVKTRNGQGVLRQVNDPYAYKGLAVIVAAPKHESDYKPGDIVQINQPQSSCPIPDNDFVLVQHSYLHPLSKHPEPPTDVKDPDFGYLMMPRSLMILKVPNEQIPEIYKPA